MSKINRVRHPHLLKHFLLSVILLAVFAVILTWLLEFRYFFNNFDQTWEFVFGRKEVFLFNALIMFFLLLIVYAVIWRPWITIGLMGTVVLVISYINENKLSARMTPLLPEDFQLATEVKSLSKFVDANSIIILAASVLLVLALAWILNRLTRKIFIPAPYLLSEKWYKKHAILPRVLVGAGSIILLLASTNFIINHDGSKYKYVDWLKTTFTAWNQERNYRENGFLIGFLYNWSKFEMQEPKNYHKESIKKIAQEYLQKSNQEKKSTLKDADYNIVIVLNESFINPDTVAEFYPDIKGKNITPNLHKMLKQYPSGQMYSLDYGGGTANIEFEALTGMTSYWTNTVPYTNLIPKAGAVPSIATWAKAHNYETTAIHAYFGGMYKRNISLKHLSFERFITSQEMDGSTEPGSEYLNDQASYDEVLNVLNSNKEKQLVTLITMQNHTPYHQELYGGERHFKIDYADEEKKESAEKTETYFEGLHYSDKYLGEFIQKLDESDEKTVVLFFGDHSPGVFSELAESEQKEVFQLSRFMPYFIYANFELTDAPKDLPTTTPNCLNNTLYNVLGVEKPTLNYLLDEVCEKNPILTAAYFGEAGIEKTPLLEKYEMVTYDILGGKKYWLEKANW